MFTRMQRLISVILCSACAILISADSYASDKNSIIVYYSEKSDFQKQLARALNSRFNTSDKFQPVTFVNDDNLKVISPGDLIVSIGTQIPINKQLRSLRNNIIYINDSSDDIEQPLNNKSYINTEITQPVCRHLNLIHTINHQWKRVGYMTSRNNDGRLKELRVCAKTLGITITDILINNDDDLPGAIDRLVMSNDVLLALPDSKVYNRRSVKNILLSAYRQRIPVIGFSENFVSAGALAAVYSSAEHIAEQVANSVLELDNTYQPVIHTHVYPKGFTVSVNKQVAKALDLDIPSEKALHKSLKDTESGL